MCSVNAVSYCSMNWCQHFPHEKTLFFKQKFCSLSFEEHKMYGLDILRRFHTRRNMKWQNFIMIQKVDICETTWYKIVGLLRFYKLESKWGCWFLPHGNKGTHKLWSPRSLIDLCVDTMSHRMKGIGMVDKMCGVLLFDTWKNLK